MQMWRTRQTVGHEGTGWGLVNAVSELYDWERSGGTAQSRFLGAIEGQTRGALDKVVTRIMGQYGRN
jgi:hypothetical protein